MQEQRHRPTSTQSPAARSSTDVPQRANAFGAGFAHDFTRIPATACTKGQASNYGCFDTETYAAFGRKGSETGVEIVLTFEPFANVDAQKIGLTQSVRTVHAGQTKPLHPRETERIVPGGTGQGRKIDQATALGSANPLYATDDGTNDKRLSDSPTVARGQHYVAGQPTHKKAILRDKPKLEERLPNSSQVFETAALAIEGNDRGKYLGSVEWGWRIDAADQFEKLQLKLISAGVPSAGFMAAAKQWNQSMTGGTIVTRAATDVYERLSNGPRNPPKVGFRVPPNTAVRVHGNATDNGIPYNDVWVPSFGESGYIMASDLFQAADTRATIPLPIEPTYKVKGGGVEVRSGASSSAPIVATLTEEARFEVVNSALGFGAMNSGYDVEIEVEASRPGVTLISPDPLAQGIGFGPMSMPARKVRGFIPRGSYEDTLR